MSKLENYTQVEFDAALADTLKELLVNPLARKSKHPVAVLLGGQSGAGKSTLHRIFKDELHDDAIVINGDEYRKSHPRFDAIQAKYGMDAPAHTAAWSGAMTEALIDALSNERFNLVIEGTLRTSAVPLGTAELLRSRGYAVSLAVMAVKPEISLVSCQIRYEMMRIAGTTPRATDPEHHAKIVHDIVSNIATLEESGAFDGVELYDRAGRLRYPADDAAPSAGETLETILFGEWTPEERGHLEHLKARLEELKGCK